MQLPKQIILQYSTDPVQSWEWVPPSVPDFAGPKDLAALLISYRARLAEIRRAGGRPDATIADLPDASLESLLTVAYKASFLKEEGRPVRACLHALSSWEWSSDDIAGKDEAKVGFLPRNFFEQMFRASQAAEKMATNSYRFDEPVVLDDPKHIAKFAPTLAADDAVLVVRDKNGQLVCTEVTLLDYLGAENSLLTMPRGWGGDGLFVHILAPGELRVREAQGEIYASGERNPCLSVGELCRSRPWLA